MNQIVHLNTMNCIVCTWTILSIKSCYLPGFLKPGYDEKIIKDNRVRSILSFHTIFINLRKILQSHPYCPLRDSLLIFIKSLCFISVSSIFWKIWINCPFRKIWPTFIKKHTYMTRCCIFLMFSDQEAMQLDPYCPFKDLICVFKDLIQISTEPHYFLVFKCLLKICVRDNTVWPILSFQGLYINFHQKVLKCLSNPSRPIHFFTC